MQYSYQSEIFQHTGLTFRLEYFYDATMGEPWKEHDGHGRVSSWTQRDKLPGERVLHSDRDSKRYYDFASAVKTARREGWDCEERRKLDPENKMSKGTIAAMAVEQDFKRLQDWCEDQWHWCGIVVTLLNVDGNQTTERASLWGIESDSDDAYFRGEAQSLAEEIAERVPADGQLKLTVRA